MIHDRMPIDRLAWPDAMPFAERATTNKVTTENGHSPSPYKAPGKRPYSLRSQYAQERGGHQVKTS